MSDAVIPPPLSPDELGPDTSPVAYETALDGALAYVTLNRPDFRNAQNSVMTYSLDSAFRKAVDDPAVKVIVLRAAGKHFSAGHDIGTPERDFHVYYDNAATLHWDHTTPGGSAETPMTADQRLARETEPQGGQRIGQLARTIEFRDVSFSVRRGEVLGMRWRDLDLDSRRLTIARSFAATPKSGKPRTVPLSALMVDDLAEWRTICPKSAAGLVCPTGEKRAAAWLADLLKEIGCTVPIRPWHTLRHTFASHFLMSGGSLITLQRLLGHSTVAVTQIYSHLSDEHIASEVKKLRF